jgi:hypothetical protein
MAQHGFVDLGNETHEYKDAIKRALGGDEGIGNLLQSKGQTNFDFYVERDGTIWISDNDEGGRGVETSLNFFDMFEEHRPAQVEVAAQERNYDLPASDSDSDSAPVPGEIYIADDGNRYFISPDDGITYAVHLDSMHNTYYIDASGHSRWTHE